jgi:hypothetical protein
VVRVGQIVKAGDVLGRAGLARAFHIHLMANRGGTMKGIGEFDPRPILDFVTRRSAKG